MDDSGSTPLLRKEMYHQTPWMASPQSISPILPFFSIPTATTPGPSRQVAIPIYFFPTLSSSFLYLTFFIHIHLFDFKVLAYTPASVSAPGFLLISFALTIYLVILDFNFLLWFVTQLTSLGRANHWPYKMEGLLSSLTPENNTTPGSSACFSNGPMKGERENMNLQTPSKWVQYS